MKQLRWGQYALLVVFLALQSSPAWASGFALYQAGARSSSLAGAVVARADDLSAIFYNPAGLTQLPGLQVMAGVTAIFPATEIVTKFYGLSRSNEMQDNVFFPPHFYISYQAWKNLWLGLGGFSPFGLGVEFDPKWPGQVSNIRTMISSFNLNPTVALKVTDYLSLAAGLDVMYFDLEMRRTLPLPYIGFQDTNLSGDSWGVGFNVGALVKPADFISLGLSYRSQVKQTVEGNARFAPAHFLTANANGDITLPDMIFGGVMLRPLKPLTVEVGFIWTHWSLFNRLATNFHNPLGTLSEPKNWRDTWRFQVGVEYKVTNWLDLRAGYAFDEEPIPGEYADYIVPTSNSHWFTFGPGFRWRNFTLDLSYTYLFMPDHTVNNSHSIGVFPTDFQGRQAHIAGASLGYKF